MDDFFQPHILFIATATLICFALSIRNTQRKSSLRNSIQIKRNELKTINVSESVAKLMLEIDVLNEKMSNGEKFVISVNNSLAESELKSQMINVGLIPPTFCFTDSETLKEEIKNYQEEQYKLVKSDKATKAMSDWTWFGSRGKGEQMVESYRYLLLKAFNAEFDFIRKQMRHTSFDTAKSKLERLNEQLARLGETANVSIDWNYANLRFKELQVWHKELLRKETLKQEKKKQQALLRSQKEQTGQDSEELEDDLYYRKSDLNKAKALAKKMHGSQLARVDIQVRQLQKEIDALELKFSRATSQAQITKAGYIYVISNIGSFGQGIVKIGMTRRLEPMDRVNELGDASVPFRFDVHTLVFVNDAPNIEKTLHRRFNNRRVNTDNYRKEFFKVSPDEVREAMNEINIEADWFFEIEAKEYRESLLIRDAYNQDEKLKTISSQLPDTI